MSTKKTPLSLQLTDAEIKGLRRKLGLNQSEFWTPLGVTQSGGSRYESGRNIPNPTSMLIHLVYLSNNPADDLQAHKKALGIG